ncbi:protein DEK isoform 2-T2 [Menidia menidia]
MAAGAPSSVTGGGGAVNRSPQGMSDVEAVDSSAVSEDDGKTRIGSKASAVGEILEGKRAKKTVERLDLQAPKQKEKLRIGDGGGDRLGEIPRTSHQISRMKPAELKPLHSILFDRPGKMATIKKNLRLFNGFPFSADSDEFSRKRDKLLKSSNLTNTKLKVVCTVLDLEKKGTHSDLIDRILSFLTAPKNSGKRVPVKKKKKSKKKLSSEDSKPRKQPPSSSSPKKARAGSKSKAIVMDSSSDEDEAKVANKVTKVTAKVTGGEESDSEGRSSGQSEEEEESSKKKQKKKKTPRTPAKKTPPPKKRPRREESESEAEEQPKKKKPGAKTKKADSSSNRNPNTDDSSDDEPLINMIKKPPTEETLRRTLQALLQEADLEEMTMKQICQRVFDTFPEHDLSAKKDFIKKTVKELIT